jgi:hypothetical protein
LLFIGVDSKRFGFCVTPLESIIVGSIVRVDSKRLGGKHIVLGIIVPYLRVLRLGRSGRSFGALEPGRKTAGLRPALHLPA